MVSSRSSEQRITSIVANISQRESIPYDVNESLFESGYLNPSELPGLFSELEAEFGIKIPYADRDREKFDTIARIESYIKGRTLT